jgi:hypothetical protein
MANGCRDLAESNITNFFKASHGSMISKEITERGWISPQNKTPDEGLKSA